MKKIVMSVALFASILTSCTTMNNSMREPNTRVDLVKSDFMLSEQYSAEAQTIRILGIDWNRLFKNNSADINKDTYNGNSINLALNAVSIPIVGGLTTAITDRTANYALYTIMQDHKGYDVAFYPQYETKVERPIGLGFIYKITTVKATTRLGKLKQ